MKISIIAGMTHTHLLACSPSRHESVIVIIVNFRFAWRIKENTLPENQDDDDDGNQNWNRKSFTKQIMTRNGNYSNYIHCKLSSQQFPRAS